MKDEEEVKKLKDFDPKERIYALARSAEAPSSFQTEEENFAEVDKKEGKVYIGVDSLDLY